MEFLATSTPKSACNGENTRKNGARGNKITGSKSRYPILKDNYNLKNDLLKKRANTVNYCVVSKPSSNMPEKNDLQKTPTEPSSKKLSSDNNSAISKEQSDNIPSHKAQISNNNSADVEVNKISVAVRIRPISGREILNDGEKNIIGIRNKALYVDVDPRKKANQYKFNVDHIFQSFDENDSTYSSQEKIFKTIGVPLLESAFKGYNACLLAYGQTGSGKSFSMMGRSEADIDSEEYSGLIPRFCRDLMTRKNNLPDNCSASLNISYFEIYNEKIYDLLSAEDTPNRNTLRVRENPVSGPYVENLSVKTVKTYEELRLWLLIGNKNRAIASTYMNEQSSRSHSIFKVELNFLNGSHGNDDDSRSRRSSVSLVDLAGNERLINDKMASSSNVKTPRLSMLELTRKSGSNEEKHRESISINKSLLTLGQVISSLADKKTQYVPYRDSILTWLLKESIGGNSLTTMLATITPSNLYIEETLATLRYACKAKLIVNRAQINENPQEKIIRELKLEVLKLKSLQSNYEASISSNICSPPDKFNTSSKDLEKLRIKLDVAENKLAEAEISWEQKFAESKAAHKTSLEELEKLKEELESRMRIMTDSSKSIDLTPYKSNFLEELESVLEEDVNTNISERYSSILEWCRNNFVNYYLTSQNDLILTDYKNKRQTTVTVSDLNSLEKYKDVEDMMTNITWSFTMPNNLVKKDIVKSINALYRSLANILPPELNEDLDNLYLTISKSVQKYETVLLSVIQKCQHDSTKS